MSDRDSSDRLSGSHTEGELEEEGEMEEEGERDEEEQESTAPSFSQFSSSLHAVIRIKQKYLAMKKRRLEMSAGPGGAGVLTGAPSRTSPKIFTFDGMIPSTYQSSLSYIHQRKKRRKKRRVMFPTGGGCRAPPRQERSRAKYCLYLLCAIVFLQVYNAIENLDDHVLRYDLEGLERTLRREVFGQQGAVDGLLAHMKDYLSTYVHNKPLVLSLHGPSGVGKSHLGRLLAGHFRSVVGEALVLQYYVLHHCPQEDESWHCARALSVLISEAVTRAEEEEKIPLFIFDEAEHMHSEILDALRELVVSKRSNEYLNAIYLFLSNLGHAHITKHLLHNSSSISMAITAAGRHGNLIKELTPILRNTLEKHHLLWTEAEILPLGLLEKHNVMDCFLDEMTREGFYPDHTNIERLAGELEYYPSVGGHEYARTGCKQVVAKVNLL
ncbi:torsin-4A [Polymixia lowei]